MTDEKALSPEGLEELLEKMKARFEKNRSRHAKLEWAKVEARLKRYPSKVWSLNEMELSGGEPDVTGQEPENGAFIFTDCSAESPAGRRNLCYDRAALDSRKENKPRDSAMDMAAAMGVELLSESEYRELQKLGEFDLKTSSWVKTPSGIRKLGGAVFMEKRYNTVFIYHNSSPSYYGVRGFRASIKI